MGPHRRGAGRIVAVGPDIGLEGDVAEVVIFDGLGAPARDRIAGEAVQTVIGKALGEALIRVHTRRQVRERVIGIGEVRHRIRDADLDEELGIVSPEFRQTRAKASTR